MELINVNEEWKLYYKNKNCGTIKDGGFHIFRASHKHYYIRGRGYPISEAILLYLKEQNISWIELMESRVKGYNYYRTTVDEYLSSPLFNHEGYDDQRCFPLRKMDKVQRW